MKIALQFNSWKMNINRINLKIIQFSSSPIYFLQWCLWHGIKSSAASRTQIYPKLELLLPKRSQWTPNNLAWTDKQNHKWPQHACKGRLVKVARPAPENKAEDKWLWLLHSWMSLFLFVSTARNRAAQEAAQSRWLEQPRLVRTGPDIRR